MSVYAVNLGDLVCQKSPMPSLLLRPVLDDRPVNAFPGRTDGVLLRLTCEEDRASAIVEVVRMKLRRDQFRMYVSKTGAGGWKPV